MNSISSNLFNKLDLLETEIKIHYDLKIGNLNKDLIFCEDTSNEDELATCLIIDIVDEINGGTYSVYVTKIYSKGGFDGSDLNDLNNQNYYSIHDISSIYNMIELIRLIEDNND